MGFFHTFAILFLIDWKDSLTFWGRLVLTARPVKL